MARNYGKLNKWVSDRYKSPSLEAALPDTTYTSPIIESLTPERYPTSPSFQVTGPATVDLGEPFKFKTPFTRTSGSLTPGQEAFRTRTLPSIKAGLKQPMRKTKEGTLVPFVPSTRGAASRVGGVGQPSQAPGGRIGGIVPAGGVVPGADVPGGGGVGGVGGVGGEGYSDPLAQEIFKSRQKSEEEYKGYREEAKGAIEKAYELGLMTPEQEQRLLSESFEAEKGQTEALAKQAVESGYGQISTGAVRGAVRDIRTRGAEAIGRGVRDIGLQREGQKTAAGIERSRSYLDLFGKTQVPRFNIPGTFDEGQALTAIRGAPETLTDAGTDAGAGVEAGAGQQQFRERGGWREIFHNGKWMKYAPIGSGTDKGRFTLN